MINAKTIINTVIMGATLAGAAPKTLQEVADNSAAYTYTGENGAQLPYRLLSPDIADGKKYPLIVFLHGAGERGTDNALQLLYLAPLRLAYESAPDGSMQQISHKAFMVFPQCGKKSQWVLVPWGDKKHSPIPAEPSPEMANVHELVSKLKRELPIDERRIYITGLSMGGYGTWDYITRWPEEVAAAIVVCGGADNDAVRANNKVNSIPIRIYHGSLDPAVPVERGRDAFAAVRDVNDKATYIEYGKSYHGIWTRAYSEPGLADWLFGNVRK